MPENESTPAYIVTPVAALGKPRRIEAPVGNRRYLALTREPNDRAIERHRLLLVEDRGTHAVTVGGFGIRNEDDLDGIMAALMALAADVEAGGLP